MKIILAIIVSLISIGSFFASESDKDALSLTFKIGAEYNSNLTVEELDIDSNESGFLTNLELFADYRHTIDDSSSIQLSYEFSQSLHEEFSEFDTQGHGLSAGYEKESEKFIYSADYNFYDTKLDGNNLLSMHFFTPAIAYMVNNNFLLRADYTYIDKQFDEFTERDAVSNGAGLSAFYFFNDAKSYIRLALNNSDEDAVSDELDYSSIKSAISFKTPATWISDNANFKASFSYSDRDYDHITLSINELRSEQKTQFKSSLSIPYNDTIEIIGAYEYIDRVSNLEIANYEENRVMVSVLFSL